MFIIEIPNPELIDKRVSLFFTRIDSIISKENHIYKHPGDEKILEILNSISEELGLSIYFFQEDGIWLISEEIEIEVFCLGEIEKRFRKKYRHLERGRLSHHE